jgi:hypothetical protein
MEGGRQRLFQVLGSSPLVKLMRTRRSPAGIILKKKSGGNRKIETVHAGPIRVG